MARHIYEPVIKDTDPFVIDKPEEHLWKAVCDREAKYPVTYKEYQRRLARDPFLRLSRWLDELIVLTYHKGWYGATSRLTKLQENAWEYSHQRLCCECVFIEWGEV